MPREDFSVIWRSDSFQADLLKSILEGNGIPALLEDEFLGRMEPYAVEGVKVLVARDDLEEARPIVEQFVKDSTITS